MVMISLELDGKRYEINGEPYTFTAEELNAVERETGMLVSEWSLKLRDRRGSSLAWSSLAWIAKRRAGEFVKFHEFVAGLSTLELLNSVENVPLPASPPAGPPPNPDPAAGAEPGAEPEAEAAPAPDPPPATAPAPPDGEPAAAS